jgi:hypothetical protein
VDVAFEQIDTESGVIETLKSLARWLNRAEGALRSRRHGQVNQKAFGSAFDRNTQELAPLSISTLTPCADGRAESPVAAGSPSRSTSATSGPPPTVGEKSTRR